MEQTLRVKDYKMVEGGETKFTCLNCHRKVKTIYTPKDHELYKKTENRLSWLCLKCFNKLIKGKKVWSVS